VIMVTVVDNEARGTGLGRPPIILSSRFSVTVWQSL